MWKASEKWNVISHICCSIYAEILFLIFKPHVLCYAMRLNLLFQYEIRCTLLSSLLYRKLISVNLILLAFMTLVFLKSVMWMKILYFQSTWPFLAICWPQHWIVKNFISSFCTKILKNSWLQALQKWIKCEL